MATQEKKAASAAEVVLAPLVQAKVGGRIMHFYQGDTLPEGTAKESVDNLRSLGFLGTPKSDDN